MEIVSPCLQRLFAYWESRSHAPFPKRAEFRPHELRFILGGMSLIDVHWEPVRFLYRLHGIETARWVGFDLTGKFLDQCPNEGWAARAREHLCEVAITGAPALAWQKGGEVGAIDDDFETLALPISHDGPHLDMLITAVARHGRVTPHAMASRAPLPVPRPYRPGRADARNHAGYPLMLRHPLLRQTPTPHPPCAADNS
jgi:hypothetical protein